jgi:hypothetical protein
MFDYVHLPNTMIILFSEEFKVVNINLDKNDLSISKEH